MDLNIVRKSMISLMKLGVLVAQSVSTESVKPHIPLVLMLET